MKPKANGHHRDEQQERTLQFGRIRLYACSLRQHERRARIGQDRNQNRRQRNPRRVAAEDPVCLIYCSAHIKACAHAKHYPWSAGDRHAQNQSACGYLLSARPRMRLVVHPLHLPRRQVRVSLRRREPLVPQYLLDRAQVRALLQHVRAERMAQRVRMHIRR